MQPDATWNFSSLLFFPVLFIRMRFASSLWWIQLCCCWFTSCKLSVIWGWFLSYSIYIPWLMKFALEYTINSTSSSFHSLYLFILFFVCTYVCVSCACLGHTEAPKLLVLELLMVVGARNQVQVLHKSTKYYWWISHLSSPYAYIMYISRESCPVNAGVCDQPPERPWVRSGKIVSCVSWWFFHPKQEAVSNTLFLQLSSILPDI